MQSSFDTFASHTQTLVDFYQFRNDPAWAGDRLHLNIAVTDLLYELLATWSAHNQTTPLWTNAETHDLGHIIFLHAHDPASDTAIHIGLHQEGLYLEMNIVRPENLLQMSDDFWSQWLELRQFGQFELLDNEVFSGEDQRRYPQFFTNTNSSLVHLMRNLIAFPLLNEFPIDLGDLCITWPPDKYAITEVARLGAFAFERLWHLNQRLQAPE